MAQGPAACTGLERAIDAHRARANRRIGSSKITHPDYTLVTELENSLHAGRAEDRASALSR